MQKIINLFRKERKINEIEPQNPLSPPTETSVNQTAEQVTTPPPSRPVNKFTRLYFLISTLMLVTSFATIFLWNKANFSTLYYDLLPYEVRKYIRFPDIFKNKSRNSDLTQINQVQTQKEYRSTYWGFSVRYPPTFKAIEITDGVILANFEWSYNKTDYRLAKEDVDIEISVVDQKLEKPWYSRWDMGQKYADLSVADQLVPFYYVTSPGSQGAHTYIASEIIHEDFTYRFKIEKGYSVNNERLNEIAGSFKFLVRDKYLPPQNPPAVGMKRFINTHWGFSFDYPEGSNLPAKIDPFYTAISHGNQTVIVQLLPRYLSLTGNFQEDAVREISNACAADGPGSSIYCSKEEIRLEPYQSKNGAQGYIIKRKKILENRNFENPNETTRITLGNEKVVAYPLSIQEYYAILFSPVDELSNGVALEIGDTFQKLEKK